MSIFIVDGYMGIYDTIYLTVGEYEQKIEASWWQQPERAWPTGYENAWTTGATVGQKITFRYEIENHQFSTYSTTVQASVWKENEKVVDLFSGDVSIGQFGKEMVEWPLSSEELPGVVLISWGKSSPYSFVVSTRTHPSRSYYTTTFVV